MLKFKMSIPHNASSFKHHWKYLISSLYCLLVLSACSSESSNPAQTAITLSPALNQAYQQSCALCHTKSSTGAPQTGDTQAWQKILAKGMANTLERTINGYGGMPPGGQCFECTPDDLSTLILFMSQSASSNSSTQSRE